MIAMYISVDNDTLAILKTLSGEDLINKLAKLENAPNAQTVDIGKLWDVIHFVLTKHSATNPVPDNFLSEAIVGIETFSEEADDFISYSEWGMVAEIAEALDKVDFAKLMKNQNLKDWRQYKLFPKSIWDDKKANLTKEMTESFNELRTFYGNALDNGDNVVVRIL